MEDYIELPICTIRYRLSGQGPAVILVHGYLENLEIWDDIVPLLEQNYTVLRVDLPGHGKSVCRLETISMDLMADSISAVMTNLGIKKAFMVGHSMGGYTTLAFAERYPNWLSGLCLLHSSTNADPPKTPNRMNDIETLRTRKRPCLPKHSSTICQSNLERMDDMVDKAIQIALGTSDQGIIGALNGMALRPDRNHIVDAVNFPLFFIFGKYDNLIPIEVATTLAEKHKKARTVILNNSGHMGFIEEKDQTAAAITSFLTQVFS
jgi:pimeloyl-ACP methyl ester carboxylesterase